MSHSKTWNKVSQNAKFSQNREIKVSRNKRTSKLRNYCVVKNSWNKVFEIVVSPSERRERKTTLSIAAHRSLEKMLCFISGKLKRSTFSQCFLFFMSLSTAETQVCGEIFIALLGTVGFIVIWDFSFWGERNLGSDQASDCWSGPPFPSSKDNDFK